MDEIIPKTCSLPNLTKKRKSKVYTAEELKQLNRDDLEDYARQLSAHNTQLQALLRRTLTEKCSTPAGRKNFKNKKDRPFDFSKHPTRHVLLKFAYLGWDYDGYAVQEDTLNTIEHILFDALCRVKFLPDRETANYHRCGRTDKGVSAFSQVVSLTLRSRVPVDEQGQPGEEEINYVEMLNRVLPKEIRMLGWCPVTPAFSARFDCSSRTYKYFFPKGSLNLQLMQEAGTLLEGSHDFRNLCKMDVGNGVMTFRRTVDRVNISLLEDDCLLQQLTEEQQAGAIVDSNTDEQQTRLPSETSDIASDTEQQQETEVTLDRAIALHARSCERSSLHSPTNDTISEKLLQQSLNCDSPLVETVSESTLGKPVSVPTTNLQSESLFLKSQPTEDESCLLSLSSLHNEIVNNDDSEAFNCKIMNNSEEICSTAAKYSSITDSEAFQSDTFHNQNICNAAEDISSKRSNSNRVNSATKSNYKEAYSPSKIKCKTPGSDAAINELPSLSETEASSYKKLSSERESGNEMCVATIRSKAFLWHQIRAMMAVLVLVGEEKEDPSIVAELLDIDANPSRPQYSLASEAPLCLFATEYPTDAVQWRYCPLALEKVQTDLQHMWAQHAIRSGMILRMLKDVSRLRCEASGNQTHEPLQRQHFCLAPASQPRVYRPLLKRKTCASLETRIEHYAKRRRWRVSDDISEPGKM